MWRSHYQRVWHGTTSPAATSIANANCSLGARMSLQLLGQGSNNTLVFAGVHSYIAKAEGTACTSITLLDAIVDAPTGMLHLTPATTDTIGFGIPLGFSQCTQNSKPPLRPTRSWSGMISRDLSTFRLYDSERCELAELSNLPATTPSTKSRRASVAPPPPSPGIATAAMAARKTARSAPGTDVTTPKGGSPTRRLSETAQVGGGTLTVQAPTSTTQVCPAPTPPAPASQYYGQYATCADCVQDYGWCTGDITIGGATYLGGCYGGSTAGPNGGSCSPWVWSSTDCPDAPPPNPPPSPPYLYYSTYSSCWSCTEYDPQGWCPGTITLGGTTYEGGCFSGSTSGPMGGSCDGWVWYQSNCANAPPPSPPPASPSPPPTYSYYSQYSSCADCVQYYGWCQGDITSDGHLYYGGCFGGDETGPTAATCDSSEGGTWIWSASDCPPSAPAPPLPPPTYSYYSQYSSCADCVQYYGWCQGDITSGGSTWGSGCYGGDANGPTGATCDSSEGGTWVWSASNCPSS